MSRERSLYGKEEIITVAIGIVENEGETALSARRIAKELGVSSMTIYNYVKNLNDIKKRVVISGFDRLYNSVYQSLIGLQPPVGRRTMCRTMALEVFRFAQKNRSVFSFMFFDGRNLFHEDAEVRPFYAFLTRFVSRPRGHTAGWQPDDMPYNLLEIIITTISYQCAEGVIKLSEQDFMDHVNFYLERCIED